MSSVVERESHGSAQIVEVNSEPIAVEIDPYGGVPGAPGRSLTWVSMLPPPDLTRAWVRRP